MILYLYYNALFNDDGRRFPPQLPAHILLYIAGGSGDGLAHGPHWTPR